MLGTYDAWNNVYILIEYLLVGINVLMTYDFNLTLGRDMNYNCRALD